jgi:hypothetical protein
MTGLPLPPRPSHLALSFRRRAFLGRVILRRPSASCWFFVYVTGRRSRLDRFGRTRRHFIHVTFRIRFAAARAGRADRVGHPPILDAMVVRQEAPPRGKGQRGVMFADEAAGHVNQQLRQPGAGPEQGTSQVLNVDSHVNGLPRAESAAAAKPAVEARSEFEDELGGLIAVGGSVRAGKAGEAHCLSRGSVFGIDQGQFVNAPFAIEAASMFAPIEIVAIQFPVVAFRIAPVLAQDLRPFS